MLIIEGDCPRRAYPRNADSPFLFDKAPDHWRADRTCSYCGSLHPEDFLARLRAGDAEVIPTDKRYKAYIRNAGGAPFRQTYRDCHNQGAHDCPGPDACMHWVTREVEQPKFYFPHFSEDQMRAFVDLYNARAMKVAYPGHLYVLPYFMVVVSDKQATAG